MPENEPIVRRSLSGLTERQRQCIELVGKGLTSKQIARLLKISPSTVDNHVRAAVILLGSTSRTEAARKASQEQDVMAESAPSEAMPLSVRDKPATSIDGLPEPIHFLEIPPFGGNRNDKSKVQRFVYVALVALIGTMLFAALTSTIAGIVGLFLR